MQRIQQKRLENGARILLATKRIKGQRKTVTEGQMSPWNVFFFLSTQFLSLICVMLTFLVWINNRVLVV